MRNANAALQDFVQFTLIQQLGVASFAALKLHSNFLQ